VRTTVSDIIAFRIALGHALEKVPPGAEWDACRRDLGSVLVFAEDEIAKLPVTCHEDGIALLRMMDVAMDHELSSRHFLRQMAEKALEYFNSQ